ncbi:MAG TPA: GNAT family N-acetyltransferase [Candidatus Limnocylindrales bacterium]|nr:GNAT family N-acetyltransferase [Candidatus Limnocylindrales bacterium]
MTLTSHDGAVELETFDRSHVRAAAALVAARVRRERDANPILPPARADAATHVAILDNLADSGSGVAALRAGILIGFQAALLWGEGNERRAWVPDVAHAAADGDTRLGEALYARLAADWVSGGRFEHAVTVLAHETGLAAAYVRLEFGMRVVDLVRDLAPAVVKFDPSVAIRRADTRDAGTILALEDGLRRHLAAAPTFHPWPARPLDEQERRLADVATATFLAEDAAGTPVAYLRIGPSSTDVAMVVRDPGTASITGAFTVPERRGEDVATGLLDRALAWARENGYVRCAVDHESANLQATRFWSRHFAPAAFTYVRRVSPAAVAWPG